MDTLVVKLKNQYLTFITKHTKTLGKKVDNETHSKVKERKKKKESLLSYPNFAQGRSFANIWILVG